MSAETGGDTSVVYVELINEGTFVLRPVEAVNVSENCFKILELNISSSDVEEWMFLPGSVVECAWEEHEGELLMVAKKAREFADIENHRGQH
ncbi:hypothetical protein [Planctopirus hydrillae]|uniref:Uncharacterized protein n=1 Tax=Planctopirus hydrillae TaxID=1841610 RepID=A0A1C3ETM7_9PLAN|nr:hypothetical protein [Planctopirus hydrillae]ODA36620.1 hypothetical protein A6X21_15930 [Planctopirus hydrillae]